MSSRPRVVTPEAEAAFEVDPHGAQSEHEEPEVADDATRDIEDAGLAAAVAMGWTPEEATQLICAIWNFGMLVWGPEWAAHPEETAGWNISAAQLLDQFLPKGTGGFVQLGAGLIMVGNGIAMMGVRRIPIIQRGPRPMWVKKPPAPEPQAQPAPASPPPAPWNGEGSYRMPRGLVPPDAGDVGHL